MNVYDEGEADSQVDTWYSNNQENNRLGEEGTELQGFQQWVVAEAITNEEWAKWKQKADRHTGV